MGKALKEAGVLKFDNLDLKILRELDKNSRQSLAELARVLKKPKATVRYRLARLYEQGVIQRFLCVVDRAKIGYSLYKVYLRLHNLDEKRLGQLISHLQSSSKVSWVVSLLGRYDLAFTVLARNPLELRDFLDEVNSKFSKIIRKRQVSTNVSISYIERGHLMPAKSKARRKRRFGGVDSQRFGVHKLDITDQFILHCLSESSRISASEISRLMQQVSDDVKPISPEAIIQRIEGLEKKGVIVGYSLVIDTEALNRAWCKVLLSLSESSQATRDDLFSSIEKIDEAVMFVESLGEWDIEIDLEVNDIKDAREIVMKLSTGARNLITDFEILLFTGTHKYKYIPMFSDSNFSIDVEWEL